MSFYTIPVLASCSSVTPITQSSIVNVCKIERTVANKLSTVPGSPLYAGVHSHIVDVKKSSVGRLSFNILIPLEFTGASL